MFDDDLVDDDDEDDDEESDEEMEAVEEVKEHSGHSINRLQNHRNRHSILYILRGDINGATVSNHLRQFQSIAIALCIALLILATADRGEKGWACEVISLYRLHVICLKIMRSKGFRKLQCP